MQIINTYDFLKAGPDREKTYIVFARHGESEVNALKRVGGASELANLDLTAKGVDDAKSLGQALEPFKDRIKMAYSSPLKRAHQTAVIALQNMGSRVGLQIKDGLKEKFFGEEIDGQSEETYNKFAAKEKADTKDMTFSEKWTYTVVKDAESFQTVYARVKAVMLDIAAKHKGEVVLAFGHKVSSIKVPAMGALAEAGIEVDYRDPPFNDPKNGATAVYEVDVESKKVRLVAIDGFSFSNIK